MFNFDRGFLASRAEKPSLQFPKEMSDSPIMQTDQLTLRFGSIKYKATRANNKLDLEIPP